MRDVLNDLVRWWREGRPAWPPSSPPGERARPPGATMLVGAEGTAVGSVSGGCVEGAVYELCREVIESGHPGPARYGVSDDDAFEVGLPCGGTIELFVERVTATASRNSPRWPAPSRPASRSPSRPVSRVRPSGSAGTWWSGTTGARALGLARLDDAATDDGRGLLAAGRTGMLHYGPDGERRGDGVAVLASLAPPPADDRVRGHRLRRRGGPGRLVPRLPGDRLRRAARSSPPPGASPTPTRWSSTGRTATWAARPGPGRIDPRRCSAC